MADILQFPKLRYERHVHNVDEVLDLLHEFDRRAKVLDQHLGNLQDTLTRLETTLGNLHPQTLASTLDVFLSKDAAYALMMLMLRRGLTESSPSPAKAWLAQAHR